MIRSFLRDAWRQFVGWLRPCKAAYVLAYVEGDELPPSIPPGVLLVAREGGELWTAGMICPCGCGRKIELMLLPDVEPRWNLTLGKGRLPTLSPSIRAVNGCRAHFWLREGQVHWCED